VTQQQPSTSTPGGTDLSQRYGRVPRWQRGLLVAGVAVVVLGFLAWLAWATWLQATPQAESELIGFEVTSDDAVQVHLRVTLADDVADDPAAAGASCRLRAYAEDHTTVGEYAFVPEPGRNDVVVRTERRATSVERIGCTTAEQTRAR